MSGRHVAIACAAGLPLGGLAIGTYAFGRWWAGAVQRRLDTPIGERERRLASPDFTDKDPA